MSPRSRLLTFAQPHAVWFEHKGDLALIDTVRGQVVGVCFQGVAGDWRVGIRLNYLRAVRHLRSSHAIESAGILHVWVWTIREHRKAAMGNIERLVDEVWEKTEP